MQTVNQWLEQLGLSQYSEMFKDNAVDFDLLRELTDIDLEKVGVRALGHRRKLLRAIAELHDSGPEKSAPASLQQEPSNRTVTSTDGERRQLTVLFCDIVGFTEIAGRIDPEVLRSVVRSYEDTCAAAITRFEGYVYQRLGDGIVAYFGYPLAHEAEAERAIRAAFEIVAALARLSLPDVGHLHVRVGISTGLVVVGPIKSVDKSAVGETINLAARLQSIAPRNGIVVSDRTHQLAGGRFEYEDLGAQSLKGISDPVHAWRVVGLSLAVSRFDAATLGGLTPLVGREQEIALLTERWQLAQEGEGQVVLLSGEPGIGKSRILSTLRERLEAQTATTLRFQCSPYYINSALYPVIDNFERALKFIRDEPISAKLDKLEAMVAGQYGRPVDDVKLIALVLSIPSEDRYGPLTASPQRQKEETIRVLVDLVEAIARRQPTLMLFEDVHWADPTTLELLDLLIDRVRQFAMLIIIAHRPEFHPGWVGHGHVTALALPRLSRVQTTAVIVRLATGKPLPADLVDQIVARTDGVPLFVEELTKAVLESGMLRDAGDHYEYSGATTAVAIPATLRDSLMARLDHVMPVKEIAQMGAAIGREFSYELISAVAPMGKTELDDGLQRLVASGLVFRRGAIPQAVYTFKHALVQDAAYDSLLKTKRQELHGKIARVLEEHFPAIKDTEPEVLARHYTAAGIPDRAVAYWLAAAQRAYQRFANAEAIGHARRGVEILQGLSETQARDQQELLLQTILGLALSNAKGYGFPEVWPPYARAQELCNRIGDTPQVFPILGGIFFYQVMRGKYRGCLPTTQQILELALRLDDTGASVLGHWGTSTNWLFLGDFAQALQHSEAGWTAYNELERRSLALAFNIDPGPCCADWSAWLYWLKGYPDKAEVRRREALRSAEQAAHPFTSVTVVVHGAIYQYFRGYPKVALEQTRVATAICDEVGFPLRRAEGEICEGWALAELGDTATGIARLESGFQTWLQLGTEVGNPFWFAMLALAFRAARRLEDARTQITRAFEHVQRNEEHLWEAELHRLDGLIGLEAGESIERAEACFHKAIAIANSQGAKSLELRASTALAQLWLGQGRRDDARALLAPIYEWFTEGFDTKDLKEAKELLNMVS